jgi:hypothetical protein
MRIVTIKEYPRGIPKGSVCDVIRTNKTSYRVMYCSMGGSYEITIPKSVAQKCKTVRMPFGFPDIRLA